MWHVSNLVKITYLIKKLQRINTVNKAANLNL